MEKHGAARATRKADLVFVRNYRARILDACKQQSHEEIQQCAPKAAQYSEELPSGAILN